MVAPLIAPGPLVIELGGDSHLIDACLDRYGDWPLRDDLPLRRLDLHAVERLDRAAGIELIAEDVWEFGDETARCRLDLATHKADAWVAMEAAAALKMPLDLLLRGIITTAHTYAGGVALHASAVEHNGRALVFAGPSGAGKSTLRTLLSESGAVSLADDLVLLESRGGQVVLQRTPDWQRDWDVATPDVDAAALPVAGVFVLRQGRELQVEQFSSGRSVAALLDPWPLGPSAAEQLQHTGALVEILPGRGIYRLTFAKVPITVDEILRCCPRETAG
jgi:hypothetical protein